jgi:hypothetical protein
MNKISDDYYDKETQDMLFIRLTDDDREFMKNEKEKVEHFLFNRWCIIINSLSANYYEQYSSQQTQVERNGWFKKYLEYPTKDMSLMPEFL